MQKKKVNLTCIFCLFHNNYVYDHSRSNVFIINSTLDDDWN